MYSELLRHANASVIAIGTAPFYKIARGGKSPAQIVLGADFFLFSERAKDK